jgi:hypothetical protein
MGPDRAKPAWAGVSDPIVCGNAEVKAHPKNEKTETAGTPLPSMATIGYAIVVPSHGNSIEVRHLYRYWAEAASCAAAYRRDLNCEAQAAAITPPLPLVRSSMAWATFDSRPSPQAAGAMAATLRVYASRDEALKAATDGRVYIPACIRQTMPVSYGIPQFTAKGG